jgi:hypothetical protein
LGKWNVIQTIKDTFNHEELINHQLGRTEYTSTIWSIENSPPSQNEQLKKEKSFFNQEIRKYNNAEILLTLQKNLKTQKT